MSELKPYVEFRKAIRHRESGGRYDCVNKWGYLGAFQFGMARLCDLGLARRKIGTKGQANSCFEWCEPHSEKWFLSTPKAQDEIFDRHVQDLKWKVRLIWKDENLSGAIAACHLVGYTAFLDYVRTGKVAKDALGTSLLEYMNLFRGYEIP